MKSTMQQFTLTPGESIHVRTPEQAKQMRRRKQRRKLWLTVGIGCALFAVLLALVVWAVGAEDHARDVCREDGGRVLEVHGGKGGWVCVPTERP